MWGKAKAKPIEVDFRDPVPHDRCTFESVLGTLPGRPASEQSDKFAAKPGRDYIIRESSGRIYVMLIERFNEIYDIVEPIQSSTPGGAEVYSEA